MPISFDKFSGCFLGQCLGDALGAPAEGFASADCLDYLHRQMRPVWHDQHAERSCPFGQYTDDSQLARELLISLIGHPEFDPDDYVDRLQTQFQSGLVIVPGLACIKALEKVAAGTPWQDAGCPPPQAGNGTAMRVVPVGMMYGDRPTEMIRIARQQGWITHRDPRCDAGSIAIAGAVALALQDRVEPGEFCSQLAEWMTEADVEFASFVLELPKMVSQRPEDAVESIRYAGKPSGYVDHWPGISPFVISTVLWSLYCFLHSSDDYYASIWTAIAVGGDVDTTAAITGAISGAYNGRQVLPEHMLKMLHDHGKWRLGELDALCKRAYRKLGSS
jgi:ADP-ribosylglycohydrolase